MSIETGRSDVALGFGSRPSEDVARAIRSACQRLFANEADFLRRFGTSLLALVPRLRQLPEDQGRVLAEGLGRAVLWAALTEDPLDVVEATFENIGADHAQQGFPAEGYHGVGHALLRAARDTYTSDWTSELSSGWVAYYGWLGPHLQRGATSGTPAPGAPAPGRQPQATPAPGIEARPEALGARREPLPPHQFEVTPRRLEVTPRGLGVPPPAEPSPPDRLDLEALHTAAHLDPPLGEPQISRLVAGPGQAPRAPERELPSLHRRWDAPGAWEPPRWDPGLDPRRDDPRRSGAPAPGPAGRPQPPGSGAITWELGPTTAGLTVPPPAPPAGASADLLPTPAAGFPGLAAGPPSGQFAVPFPPSTPRSSTLTEAIADGGPRTLDEVLDLLHSRFFLGNERALGAVLTRVALRTGADLRAPRPDQRGNPAVVANVMAVLQVMGYPVQPAPDALQAVLATDPPAPRPNHWWSRTGDPEGRNRRRGRPGRSRG